MEFARDSSQTLAWQRRLGLVLLSVVLASLVFPPFGLWWLAPVAWWPLLHAIRGASVRAASRLGFVFGVLLYASVLSWLIALFAHAALALWVILALFTGLFGGLFAWVSQRLNGVWVAAILWTGIEFFRCEWFWLSFSWVTPGVGLGPMFLSPLSGVYGISFCCILSCTLLDSAGWRKRLAGGVLVLLLVFSSAWVRHGRAAFPQDPLRVLAVQNEGVSIDHYLMQSDGDGRKVDLIIWPEYSVPYAVRDSEGHWPLLLELAKTRDCLVILGTQTRSGDEAYHNTALTLDADGAVGEHYKIHTVHFFNDGIAGTKAEAVETPLGKVGTPICFDCDHSFVVRSMTADGAQFFAVPSMDAEGWSLRQHWQHAELFRHRAAENGRWMAVASSSGITQIIAPNGKRVDALPALDAGVLHGEVGRSRKLTLFTRAGWLFGPLSFAALIPLLIGRWPWR